MVENRIMREPVLKRGDAYCITEGGWTAVATARPPAPPLRRTQAR
jgi:hypothetical protein